MNRLCRIERFRLQGMGFETWISRTDKGHYSAMTRLGIGDRVISDAPSEDRLPLYDDKSTAVMLPGGQRGYGDG